MTYVGRILFDNDAVIRTVSNQAGQRYLVTASSNTELITLPALHASSLPRGPFWPFL